LPSFDTGEGQTQSARPEWYEHLLKHGAAWMDEMPVVRVEQLAANGHEIARAVGQAPGPWLGWVLDRLLEDVACGHMPNDKNRLEERARQYYREWSKHE
jgi:tRNA nucleotidyltransferase (CCA-adding enzyme)